MKRIEQYSEAELSDLLAAQAESYRRWRQDPANARYVQQLDQRLAAISHNVRSADNGGPAKKPTKVKAPPAAFAVHTVNVDLMTDAELTRHFGLVEGLRLAREKPTGQAGAHGLYCDGRCADFGPSATQLAAATSLAKVFRSSVETQIENIKKGKAG